MLRIAQEIPYKGVRRVIGRRMEASNSMPQSFQGLYVDVTELLALRRRINLENEAKLSNENFGKLSINDFILKAVGVTLTRIPMVNSALIDNTIQVYESCNIGVIASVEKGIVAPVIKDTQSKDIYQISREMRELLEKASANKLTQDDCSDATFSITNIGSLNADNSVPLVFPPQAAILAICTIRKAPVVIEKDGIDTIAIRSVVNLVIGADHRVLDGPIMAKFLNCIKELLESPEQLLETRGESKA